MNYQYIGCTRNGMSKGLSLLKQGNKKSFNFPNKPWFLRVCNTSLLKTLWEKEKLLVTSNFSFSHSVFYPFEELSSIFIKFEIVVCTLFEFGSLKFVVWERVNFEGCHKTEFILNLFEFCAAFKGKIWHEDARMLIVSLNSKF